MARKQSSGTDRQGRIDLAAALRWAARLGLNEGVCNHFSLALAPDRYLIKRKACTGARCGRATSC